MIRDSIRMQLPTKDHVMYYCHHCGQALGDDARFCGACGTPRQTAAPGYGSTTAPQPTTAFQMTEVLPAVGMTSQSTRALATPGTTKRRRPAVVTWAVGLLFAYALSVGVNGIISGIQDVSGEMGTLSSGLLVALGLAVPAVFVYRGKRVARTITWIVAGLFLSTIFASILDAGATSAVVYPLVNFLVLVAAVVLLAMPAANHYFRKATPGNARWRGSEWLKLGGGVLAALSTFLPWIDYGFASFNGFTVDDGGAWAPLILVLGVVIASISTLRVNAVHITSLVLAALLTVAALTQFSHIMVNYANVVGPGTYFMLIGALAAFVGSLLAFRSGLSR